MIKNRPWFLSVGVSGAVFSFLLLFLSPLKVGGWGDDLVWRVFYKFNRGFPSRLVLVGIDNYSLSHIHYRWPWPRSVYGQLLEKLSAAGAKVVAFDLIFKGKGLSEEDDLKLSSAIKKSKSKVLLAYFLAHEKEKVLPRSVFSSNAYLAPLNTPLDKDGKIRRIRPIWVKEGMSEYAFGFKAYLLAVGQQAHIYRNKLIWADRVISLDKDGNILLNFLVRPSDIIIVPFLSVIQNEVSPAVFKDKIIFVAPLAQIIHDNVDTPLGKMPGVFIHINAVHQFLSNHLLQRLPVLITALLLLASILLITLAVYYFGFFLNSIVFISILTLLFWLDIFLGFAGFRFSWSIVVSLSFAYWLFINLARYLYILAILIKIKNRAVRDVITGLYNLRYFYYLVELHQDRHYFYQRNILAGLCLEGLREQKKKVSFSRFKEIWNELSSYLYTRGDWALGEEEILLGFVKTKKKDCKTYLREIETDISNILKEMGVENVRVKFAFSHLSRFSDLPRLGEKILAAVCNADGNDILEVENIESHLRWKRYQDSWQIIDSNIENKNLNLMNVLERLEEEKSKSEEAYLEVIASLVNALEEKDPYTQGHTKRVCDYAVMLAEYLRLPPAEIDNIRKASLLHDIGKIGIPDSILNKRGALSEEEYSIIKQHTVMGVKILEPIKHLKPVINYILYHHERFDGRGYPHGLAGKMIPQGAQIIAIADSFDAITSGRSYKGGISFKEATEKLKESKGKQFSPFLVDKFIEALSAKGLL